MGLPLDAVFGIRRQSLKNSTIMIKEISQILNYFSVLVITVVLLWAAINYWKKRNFWKLIWIMIGFRLALAFFKIALQYWVWDQSQFTRLLLHQPISKDIPGWFIQLPIFTKFSSGYFIFYSWNHFLSEAVLSIIAALVIYKLFQLLHKFNSRFFCDKEAELGFLMVLLVGWPQIISFLPLVIFIALIFYVINWLFWRKNSITMGWPLIVSAAIMLIFSSQIAVWQFLVFKI
jgi:hypothetical protein